MRAHTNPRARAFAPAVHHPEIECRIRSRIDRPLTRRDTERFGFDWWRGGTTRGETSGRDDDRDDDTMMTMTSVTNAARARAMPTKRVEVRTRAR